MSNCTVSCATSTQYWSRERAFRESRLRGPSARSGAMSIRNARAAASASRGRSCAIFCTCICIACGLGSCAAATEAARTNAKVSLGTRICPLLFQSSELSIDLHERLAPRDVARGRGPDVGWLPGLQTVRPATGEQHGGEDGRRGETRRDPTDPPPL